MTQGAGRLTSQLGALGAQTQQQGLQNLQGMFGQATRQTTMPTYSQATPSFAQQMAPIAGQLVASEGSNMGNQLLDLIKKIKTRGEK